MKEKSEFVPIPGYEGIYEMNRESVVRSVPRLVSSKGHHRKQPSKIINHRKRKNLVYVTLNHNSKSRQISVRRLYEATFGTMPTQLRCSSCGKRKELLKYTHGWQKEEKVCDYCRVYSPTAVRGMCPDTVRLTEDKKVKCLKCERPFLGRTYVRICHLCKSSDDYQFDSYLGSFSTGMVG